MRILQRLYIGFAERFFAYSEPVLDEFSFLTQSDDFPKAIGDFQNDLISRIFIVF